MTTEVETTQAAVQEAAWEAAPYIQWGVPGVPYSAIRVPLVSDPAEAAAWIDRALKASVYLQRHYGEAFGGVHEEPHYEPFRENERYVPPTQSAPQAQPVTAGQAPVCNLHNKPMKPSKFGGGWYCAAKLADGTYCQEKVG